MSIRQLSVFVENKTGRLYEITKTLGESGIDIRAVTLADTTQFGILRLIVSDPDRAMEVLKKHDFAVSITEVIGIGLQDRPGGLAHVLQVLYERGIPVDYVYAYISKSESDACIILCTDEPEQASAVLQQAGIPLVSQAY